jgi:hypothetical protein
VLDDSRSYVPPAISGLRQQPGPPSTWQRSTAPHDDGGTDASVPGTTIELAVLDALEVLVAPDDRPLDDDPRLASRPLSLLCVTRTPEASAPASAATMSVAPSRSVQATSERAQSPAPATALEACRGMVRTLL